MFTWLDRLTVAHRFTLVGALALILTAPPTALFVRQAWANIQVLDDQARGIGPSRAVLHMVQLAQQHRGLSALALAGNAEALARRGSKAQEVDQAAEQLIGQLTAQQAKGDTRAAALKAAKDWLALKGQVAAGAIDGPKSFVQHSALIGDLLDLTSRIGDEFALSLDSHLDSAQLVQAAMFVLPDLTEAMGKMRAQGAAMLQKGQLGAAAQVALGAHAAQAASRRHAMLQAYAKAMQARPELRASLGQPVAAIERGTREVLDLAKRHLLERTEDTLSAEMYFKSFTDAIDALVDVNDKSMGQLGAMLDRRSAAAHRELWLLVGALTLLVIGGATLGSLAARSITRQLGGEPVDVIAMAGAVADGDLRTSAHGHAGPAGSILGSMTSMQASLRSVVAQVRASADSIATGTSQIATGTSDLSQRTEQQASNLQQTAASMEQINATVKNNAETARAAAQLATSVRAAAESGGQVVARAVETMQSIDASSRRIAEIIGVIDGIAFQTNILALNAAVEAARAGEQGRGFAVVAAEVRALARRSADAAKQIKQLIDSSVSGVDAGAALVRDAGTAMNEIVAQVRRVAGLIQEMSHASTEQADGIGQIGHAVGQLDQMTQQNAALVEESAAAADSLSQQAQFLADVVRRFRLDDDAAQRAQATT